MAVNEWRVKPEANLEEREGATDETRMKHGSGKEGTVIITGRH
jgi:hypothetical protein